MASDLDKLARDFQTVYSTEAGKALFDELKRYCGQDSISVPSDFDIHKTLFNEGKRDVFLRFNGILNRKVKDG